MRIDDPRYDEWRQALCMHEREIQRLRVEIALLESERAGTGTVRDLHRVQIQLAHAQLTRHHISAALLATRLPCSPP